MDFEKEILPKIKQAVKDTLDALWSKLQHHPRRSPTAVNQFELLGYDFMIDQQGKVYLIEVNTNPCLDTSASPLMSRLIS